MKHQDGSGTSTSRTTESSPKSGIDESNPLQSSSGQPAGQGGGPGAGPESGSDARAALADWFTSVPGRVIAKAERSALDDRLFQLFGYYLVQVGALGRLDLLRNSRVMHRCVVDSSQAATPRGYQRVWGRATNLPLESDSVDVLLLPHVLEFESRPHDALREAVRVLVPEGHLLITAFNPYSFYGLWQLVARHRGREPWSGRFFSQARLRDWLELLGMEPVNVSALGFAPPLNNARFHARLRRMQKVSSRLPTALSCAYLVLARKRVSNSTALPARQRLRPRLVDVAIAQPSARQGQARFDDGE
ncbi:MAG: class I SAM-dependent methyltransferase [Gammaproteobacteria bacterium]|nr:class I SAM-dependent methyltransferase [Gammaproteobacteria bacterium]